MASNENSRLEMLEAQLKYNKDVGDAEYKKALARLRVEKEKAKYRQLMAQNTIPMDGDNMPILDVFGNLS